MLNYLKAFSFFLLWATIALISHYYISDKYFNTCNLEENVINENISEEKLFTINDSSINKVYKFTKGFSIYNTNSNVSSILLIPSLKDTISHILSNDYTKEIYITGKYLKTEIETSQNTNKGLQRATFIKNELISNGIDSNKIKIFDLISNYSYNKEGIYNDGIEMKLGLIKPTIIDSIEFDIANKILYVEFKNDSILLNNNLKKYTTLLKQYIGKHPAKKVFITGHTDNLGYYDKNLITGLNNANNIKDYFIKKGLDITKIETFSKGESEPIAEKTTEKGRAKNRRIEITIK